MNKDILSTFYHNLLPLFPPQTEEYVERLKPQDIQKSGFRYIFSVKNMIAISRLIEDSVINTPGIADTHVSFQYFSRIDAQLEQYKKVADASKGLWLYGIPDAPLPKLARTVAISTSNTPLESYWFVVAYGAGLYATLLAEEITQPDHGQRLYEGFFTFGSETAFQITCLLHQMFPMQTAEPIAPENQENT